MALCLNTLGKSRAALSDTQELDLQTFHFAAELPLKRLFQTPHAAVKVAHAIAQISKHYKSKNSGNKNKYAYAYEARDLLRSI